MTLLFAIIGCVYYTCENPDFEDRDSGWEFFDDGDGCALDVQQESEVEEQDGQVSVEFSVRIEGDDCDPGGVHEVEMREYDDGGGLSNSGDDAWDAVRTGEEKRYTLSCEIRDEGAPGECGCVVAAAGQETTITIVVE